MDDCGEHSILKNYFLVKESCLKLSCGKLDGSQVQILGCRLVTLIHANAKPFNIFPVKPRFLQDKLRYLSETILLSYMLKIYGYISD